MKNYIFWDITPCSPLKVNLFRRNISPPSSGLKNKQSKKPAWTQVACSSSSTLKMEAICYSERSVDFQRTTRRSNLEDSTLHNHRCENFKSYIRINLFNPQLLWVRSHFQGSLHFEWVLNFLVFEIIQYTAYVLLVVLLEHLWLENKKSMLFTEASLHLENSESIGFMLGRCRLFPL
jgi:hypothetical protein